MTDARFEDASFSDRPLRIAIAGPEDIDVASALLQDAIGQVSEISWMRRRRRMVVLVNRFRWEDRDQAKRQNRPFERVRAALVVDDVMAVRSRGLDPAAGDTVYSILSLSFVPAEDGAGQVYLNLAGDGELALDVECLDIRLMDLTRPWQARREPSHDLT